jgi:tRNA (guanine-N7-)-methyltransferase
VIGALKHKTISKKEISHTPFVYPASSGFDNSVALIVEIGPGRGDFLFHLAETNPDKSVVGIEIKRKRADKLIKRIENRKLNNITIIQDDARTAFPRCFKNQSVDAIHINFPDPWPKRRHEKNRLFNKDFIAECCRVLKPHGTLNFATDVLWYAKEVADDLTSNTSLKNCYPETIITSSPDAFPTFFARKWKSQGRKLYYQKYERTAG